MNREERQKIMTEDKEYQEYQEYKKIKQEIEEKRVRMNAEIALKAQKQAAKSEKIKYKRCAFWVSVVAAVFPVLNFILCIKKVKATWNVQENGALRISDMLNYYMIHYMETILFWISAVLVFIGIALLCISYLKTTTHTGKTVMIVCRCIQAECLKVLLILMGIDEIVHSDLFWNIDQIVGLGSMALFAIAELFVFVLYMIDKFHRKTCLWIILLSAWTLFNIYFGMVALAIAAIYIVIIMILPTPPVEKHLIDTTTGHEIVEKWY